MAHQHQHRLPVLGAREPSICAVARLISTGAYEPFGSVCLRRLPRGEGPHGAPKLVVLPCRGHATDVNLTIVYDELSQLGAMTDAHERGYAFQDYIANVLSREHFSVERRVQTANRRSVDLFASHGDLRLLVEAKWHARRSGLPDVDDLLRRLETASPQVVGLLVSEPGFTSTAPTRAEQYASRPILLISGEELLQVELGRDSLLRLIRRKINDLTVHQRSIPPSVARARRLSTPTPVIAEPACLFVMPDGSRSAVMEFDGSFSPLVFCLELADVDWVPGAGHGVSLDLNIDPHDQDGLVNAFVRLNALGWITKAACWRIGQSSTSWNGFGLASLISELEKWEARYNGRRMHHSEVLNFVDAASEGLLTVSATIACFGSRQVSQASISFQLSGIPLDAGALISLADALPVHGAPYFRPRGSAAVYRNHMRGSQRDKRLEPVAHLVANGPEMPAIPDLDKEWVVGAVVPNPFTRSTLTNDDPDYDVSGELAMSSELLVGTLGSWHFLGEQREYTIRFVESARTTDSLPVRVYLDWD